jgi:hypothetical protein
LVERPAYGCTVKADDSGPEMVKQLTMKVLNELKKRGAI